MFYAPFRWKISVMLATFVPFLFTFYRSVLDPRSIPDDALKIFRFLRQSAHFFFTLHKCYHMVASHVIRGNSTCSILWGNYPYVLAWLLTSLASGSFARFRCDACSIIFPSSKTVSLHCFLLSCWQQQTNCAREQWAPIIRISRHSLRADSKNRTVPVASTRVARNVSFVQLKNCLVTMLSYSLRCQRQHAYFEQFHCTISVLCFSRKSSLDHSSLWNNSVGLRSTRR